MTRAHEVDIADLCGDILTDWTDDWVTVERECFRQLRLHRLEQPRRRRVQHIGRWTVGRSNGADFAVSRVCRHQLADLSRGYVDSEGCLVCPWHQSRYDVTDGQRIRVE